jgi:hypothetical protein
VTIHDKHPTRLVRDLILNATEVIHPEFMTPSNSDANLLEESDIEESEDDEGASTRALWDAKLENKLAKRSSSVASSSKSYQTKKTGYSLTIGTESIDSTNAFRVGENVITKSSFDAKSDILHVFLIQSYIQLVQKALYQFMVFFVKLFHRVVIRWL